MQFNHLPVYTQLDQVDEYFTKNLRKKPIWKSMAPSNKKYLYLPVETAARELDAKLLLALFAVEQGFEVVLANRAILNTKIHQFPAGIYLSHNFDKGRRRILEILNRLGHQVMAWDEEGLVWLNEQAYQKRRMFGPSVAQLHTIFAWGNEHAKALSLDTPVVKPCGNPRADMLTAQLRPFYAEKATALNAQYGALILVNSNFGWLNYALDKVRDTETLADRLQRLAQKSRHPLEYFEYRHQVFEAFCDMLPQLSKAFPDRQIIVRPHPSESPDAWSHAVDGLDNVQVKFDSELVPWLMAASAVIHNGCTTAVETAMLGKAAIMYEPVNNPKFDSSQPRALSSIAQSVEDVVVKVKMPISLTASQSKLMGTMVAGWGENLSASLIAQYMGDEYNPKHNVANRLVGQLLIWFRNRQKNNLASNPNSASHADYIGQKFPKISAEELSARARYLSELAGLNCPEICELSDRVFRVSGAPRK